MKELQQWLKLQCERNNLSWREASLKSGLNPGAISAIMGGEQPGLKTCKALSKFFGASITSVLQMAKHIEPLNPDTAPLIEQLLLDPLFQEFLESWKAMDERERWTFVEMARHMIEHKRSRSGEK